MSSYSIAYHKGDASNPQSSTVFKYFPNIEQSFKEKRIIVHICNNIGVWGAGFVLALSRRYNEPGFDPEDAYLQWSQIKDKNSPFKLGEVQFVKVAPGICVANCVAQHDVGRGEPDGKGGFIPPIRYEYLDTCLKKIAIKNKDWQASIHMPRIGCGLAGGNWAMVEPIITKNLSNFPVIVYDLP